MNDFRDLFWTISDLSPVRKILGVLILLIILFFIISASSFLTDRRQSQKFEKERTERLAEIWAAEQRAEDFEKLAGKYKAQNELLKVQNEAQAEILKANDSKLNGDAKKLDQILEQRKKQDEEISNSANDIDFQRCQLCQDCKRSGFQLSESFCGRCQNPP